MSNDTVKNLVFFFYISQPETSGEEMYNSWESHKVLSDYQKPDLTEIKGWVNEFKSEKTGKLIK